MSSTARKVFLVVLFCFSVSSAAVMPWPASLWFPAGEPTSAVSRRHKPASNVIDNNLDIVSPNSDDNDAFVPFLARIVEATTVPASPTMTGTATATPSPSMTASLSLFASPSSTPSLSFSVTASVSPSISETPSVSRTPGGSPAPSTTMSTSPTNTGTTTATPSPSVSNGFVGGPSLPSLSASASPSTSKKPVFKPGPKTCSVPSDDNVSIACKRVVNRRRLYKQGGGIRVQVWTVSGRFRWQVRTVKKNLRVNWIAVLISTRRAPSTVTVNQKRVDLGGKRRRVVRRLQHELIENMPNARRNHYGCCGERGVAWINVQLCMGQSAKCFKPRHVVVRFKILCKKICPHHLTGTPVRMSVHQRCPVCIQ